MELQRPSFRELDQKIRHAKESVSKGRIFILNPDVVAADVLELGVSFDGIRETLLGLLEEADPGSYLGQHPPQRSYEKEIFRSELFAFRWNSGKLGCSVYLKFAFQENQFWLVSLHEERKDQGQMK